MSFRRVGSYLELSKVVKFLRETPRINNINLDENLVIFVGLSSAGLKIEDLTGYKLRTNHYLMDSLGVDKLPSASLLSSEIDQDFIDNLAKMVLNRLRKQNIISGENELFKDEQKQLLGDNGYLVIPSVLSPEQVRKLSELTLFLAQEEKKSDLAYLYGDEENRLQRVYNLISKHPAYIEVLELPIVKEVLEFYFDRDHLHHKYVLSSFQSNIIHPGGQAQQLHVDGWSFNGVPLPRWSTRLNVNFLLTDWEENNGSTLLYPGSHKLFRCPAPGEVEDSELLKLIAPKGSVVFWTGHTWHKSGTNESNSPRFGLFACFAASQLKEVSTEEEHLSVVDEEVKKTLSPEMRFMIGLDRGIKKGALHRVSFAGTKFDNLTL